ncbi:hypothetical protein Cwoe_4705 [Conexibacter woesei DSM 14684]|uniref:Uncharacterized protein n=1 Tax=Conexibacter woesei (strain DSM 14684 / CCUG 47730 / CIP 108061 / JCM 11494 / NBRC 100937 / ID131577) TaxID=469383 RepID=D3FA23_CONWI|nr:hypothetical protein Cwoe_4705 [Conexibacter woesei DSM 14684]
MSNRWAKAPHRPGLSRQRWRHALARVAAVVGIGAAAVAAGSGAAFAAGALDPEQFAIESFTTATSDMQAGGHPDVSTSFAFHHEEVPNVIDPSWPPDGVTYGRARRLEIDLPVGLVGDPTAFETCSVDQFYSLTPCPARSQVGVTDVFAAGFNGTRFEDSGIFNLERPAGEPVLLGIKPNPVLYAFIKVKVKPDGGLTAITDELPLAHPLVATDVTLWGVPADSNPANVARDWPRVPFMAATTECETTPTTTLRAYSYEGKVATATHSLAGPMENCDRVPFEPTMTATPTSRAAAGPTGLDVQIKVPQSDLPRGIATAHVDEVQIALPNGMSVSPSSANGLQACSPAQFGYRTDSAVTCPEASKIGTIAIRTPLLEQPMGGSVYLAKQNDNPFNSLLALYILAEGTGVTIKLAGRVDPDPVTGQLTTTFRDNPQLPFEQFDLAFKSGPRAPLVNPRTCGTYQSTTRITSWTNKTVSATTPMTIDQGCAPIGFRPTFDAGSVNPVGGRSSTFSLTFGRGDHDQELRDITVAMPEGLTGVLAKTTLCADGPATAGGCGEASRIGSVTTAAGPGSTPVNIQGGRVYLTGPYKDAPLGLSIVVPAVAGPFDLGNVIVRAGIYVDRSSAALRVVSEPLPRILQGIPLHVRTVNVAIDKPGFMLNPTSCKAKSVGGRITSQNGVGADVSSRFQVGDCGRLPIAPRLSLRVGTRGRTGAERTTPLTATLTQTPGQGNLREVSVKLPTILNSRLQVVNQRHACSIEQYRAERCPNPIGSASATTPLLRDPLRGPVYLLRNPARRLPDMVVRLKGTGVTSAIKLDVVAKITIGRDLSLINTFDTVPDVPVSKFTLRLIPGRNGAVGVVRNLCTKESRRARASLSFRGQNGRLVSRRQRLQIRGCAGGGKDATTKPSPRR